VDEALAAEAEYSKASGGMPAAMLNFATVYAQAYDSLRKAGNSAKAEETVKKMVALIETQVARFPAPARAKAWAAFRADDGFEPVRGLPAFVELDKKLQKSP
jgi:hypothetical protein